MLKERIDECTACPGRLEKKGAYWVCRNCGAVYSIGTHYDGTEFAYPVAPPKELPCGKMGERASKISVNKITVKEIKPLKAIESDVYRESNDLDYHECVNLIVIYLKKGEWDAAQDKICKLRNLGDPCSIAAATWYDMAYDRHVHDDTELVRSFANITEAEISKLDSIFPYVMPDFRNHILDLILSSGYVGDESTVMLFTNILPYVFNETIYSPKDRQEKIDYAFDKVISLGYPKTFKYLLTHALADNEVDRYISCLEQFAENCTPNAAQEYYEMILAVDPGNIVAHSALVEADIKADSPSNKCIADFERLIMYSQNPKDDVEKFISILINEETTTESKSNFMWALLGYYHEDDEQQKRAMSRYADLLLASKLWQKASDFYSAVLSKNTQDATVYFKLCLADMKFSNTKELIASDETFIHHPYYNKALALATKTDSDYAKHLESLMDSRNKRVKDEQERKEKRTKLLFTGIISVVTIVAIIVTIIMVGNVREYKRYSVDNIVLTIEEKVEPTKNSSYYDGYVIAFDVNIKNNSILDIVQIRGELVVYNAEGKKLLTADCIFSSLNIAAGEEVNTVLDIDCRENADILELYYADCDDLSATFKITEVLYKNAEGKAYDADPISILDLKVGSDGVSKTEKSYQEARTLFNQGKYAEAAPLFEALGLYKDSNDYCYQSMYKNALALYAQEKYSEAITEFNNIYSYSDSADKIDEITNAVLTKAEAFAETGNYISAYTILGQIGYDDTYYLYQAYQYASEGCFADAVELGLTVVVIPEGVEAIPNNYFKVEYSTNQLKKVVLPSTLKSIGYSAFYGCTNLTEINLPDGLQTIGNYAFYKCKSLKSIEIPNSVVSLGSNVFEECSRLETVSISTGLEKIPSFTFKNCTNLTTVTIKNGVEVIESSAFSGCSSLMNVSLPESLKEIQSSAFYQCTSLVEITIPSQVNSISYSAFSNCSALQRVYFVNQEGWEYNYGTKIDVSDPQKNAKTLKSVGGSTWERK